MKKNILVLIGWVGLILFFGLPVKAQEASISGKLAVPTVDLVNDQKISVNSAEMRSPASLKTTVKAVYDNHEKVKIELFNPDANSVNLVLKDKNGKTINTEVVQSDNLGITTLTINPPPQFLPGKFIMTVTDQTGMSIEQDFLWGVLAINPNKAIYQPGETANLAMAVLDDQGRMVCGAKVVLKITKPSGEIIELSTENGKIIVNPECQSHNFTLKPDFEANLKLENAGNYGLELTAVTGNGTYTINDQIEVKNVTDFEVERVSATRIFPVNNYPMVINIVAKQDFSGSIYEEVPISFEISQTGNKNENYTSVSNEGQNKKIVWKVDLKKGDKKIFSYRYKAPEISPQFYLAGPLTMATLTDLVYTEGRQWQIAADAVTPVKIRQEINMIDGSVTVGGTDAALVNLDTTKYNGATYYFEVIAKVASGTLTVNLNTGNTNTVGIGITNTGFVTVRQAFTPKTGSFDYRLNLVNGTTPVVKAARIIILQSATDITATKTQIEIGNLEVGLSMATTTPLTSPKYWKYDLTNWDAGTSFGVEVTYKTSVGVTAGSVTYTNAGVNTFTCPDGVTAVKVEAWGGGGAGGSSNTTTDGCGGGGGGAYSNKLSLAVTPGVGYTAFVGVGGTYKSLAKGGNGGTSYFRDVGTSYVSAAGGIGGTSQAGSNPGAGGVGGTATAGVGDTKWSGGRGGTGVNATAGTGGPGGSSAGIGGTGWNGATTWATLVAGTGPVGSGIGGSGGAANGDGAAPGSGNGGGGGGAGDGNSSLGGNGANGKVVVTWGAKTQPAITFYLQQDNGSFSGWTNVMTILNGGTDTVPTRIGVTGFTPSNGKNYRIVSVAGSSGLTYDIYNAKIVATQTGTVNKLESQYLLLNTKSTSIGGTLGFATLWDSTEWARTTNVYKHAADSIGVGTSAQLVDIDNSNTLVTASKVMGTGQTISGNLTMPTTGHKIDSWLLGAGEVDASRILVAVTINIPATEYFQASYRWSNDTEGEVHTTSWLAAENTAVTGVVKNTNIRARFSVNNVGDTGTVNYRLQIAPLGAAVGCTDVTSGNFIDVPTTFGVGTSLGLMTTSPQFADQASTTRQLTISGTTFVAGKMVSYSSNQTGSIVLMRNGYTEMEYVFQFTNSAADATAYCLRTSNAGSALQNYSEVAMATTDIARPPTANSFQRKTFYDDQNSAYWRSYYEGGQIVNEYSSDGNSWTAGTALGYLTNDFSVWWASIGNTEFVFVAVANGDDIKVRQGVLTNNSVTWDADVATIFDGTGTADTYGYPYISLDNPAGGNPHIWVAARYFDGTNYVVKTRSTTNTAEADPSTWTYNTASQISNDQTSSNVFANIVPLASGNMYATFVGGTAVEGCKWDNALTAWKNSAGTASCTSTTGVGGVEEERYSSGPVKIDDAGNIAATGNIVQTSGGTLYSFVNHAGSCEMWMSADGGKNWTEEDSAHNPTCITYGTVLMALGNDGIIHLIYNTSVVVIKHNTFSTITHLFGTEEEMDSVPYDFLDDSIGPYSMILDSNNIPHVVYIYTKTITPDALWDSYLYYNNRVGGAWNANPITIESITGQPNGYEFTAADATLNENNIIEIAYYNYRDSTLTAAVGNVNDAASFTLYDVDTSVLATSSPGVSIAVGGTGDTWIAYVRTDTVNDVTLAKHTGSNWATNWTIDITDNNLGYGLNIAVITSDIYVFYQDDSTDQKIVYDVYDPGSSSWKGETTLATPGSGIDLRNVHARWSYYNNNQGYIIDYLYSDGTDVYWNYLKAPSVNIDDASDFGSTAGLPGAGRQVVRTKAGVLYSFLNDGGNCEIWKSTDGTNWAQQQSATAIICETQHPTAAAIDNNQDIQVVYINGRFLFYRNYDTATDNWDAAGQEAIVTLMAGFSVYDVKISVDSSNVPHVVYYYDDTINRTVSYRNRVAGNWTARLVNLTSGPSATYAVFSEDITINRNNVPEIVVIDNTGSSPLTVYVGSSNDASSFTSYVVDSDVDETSYQAGSSIAVDTLTGYSWISYIDSGGAVSLAKYTGDHTSGQWDGTYWTTITTKTDVGYEPSIAIAGSSDIYVFYTDDSTDQKIVYDIYHSAAASPAWEGETILQTPGSGVDFQTVKAKWSFEWNNYGANRIDYLFSDGTDVFWNYLYLRRSPTKIDDASDLSAPNAGRQILRTNTGVLYSIVVDYNSGLEFSIEAWKSSDDGNSWTIVDGMYQPEVIDGGVISVSAAIDSTGKIHILYDRGDDSATSYSTIYYTTFTTSTDQWNGGNVATVETIENDASAWDLSSQDITIDANDIPHVVYMDGSVVEYANKIGGSWTIVDVESVANNKISITINEDNIPEIAYRNSSSSYLTVGVGQDNDPDTAGQWTLYNLDTTIDNGVYSGTSIGVDAAGNTWVTYKDANTYTTLYKHDDGTDWSTAGNWHQYTDSKVGNNPSIAIDGSNIYVLYADDQDDIVYDKYDGSSWSGETLLEEHAALQSVKAKWSYIKNYGSDGVDYGAGASGIPEVDYLYSDGTDVFYNRLLPSGSGPGVQDVIDTGTGNITDNFSTVSDSSGNVHLIFIDDESTDQVSYKKLAVGTTTWSSATLVSGGADNNDAYPSLTLDTTNNYLYAFWIDSSGSNLYYSFCATSTGCDAATEWAAESGQETNWYSTGTNTYVTSNYSSPGKIFAEWSNGASSPYTLIWDEITAQVSSVSTPAINQLMRHGSWFLNGLKQPFTF